MNNELGETRLILFRKRTTRGLLAVALVGMLSMHAQAATVTFGWDAATYNDDGSWEVSEFDASVPGGSTVRWNGGTTDVLVTGATTNFANITDYVSTPDFVLDRASGGGQSWQDILGDPTTGQDATWEFVFSPGDFTGTETEPIFDTGGTGDGTGLRMIGSNLNFRFQDSSTAFLELSTDLSAIGSASNFYHVVAVADLGNATSVSALYVNGLLVASGGDTSGINDWDGGDDAGLGKVGGTSPQGASFTGNFDGDVAVMRSYTDQILDSNTARNLFSSTTGNRRTATVGWDASDYDGDGTWEVSEADTANYTNAGSMVLTGSGTVNSGNTNFTNIDQWVSSPDMDLSGTGGASIETVLGQSFTQQDATIETVFRPGDFDGKHLLFEVGGSGDGVVLQIDASTLSLIFQELNSGGTGKVLQYDADLSLIGGFDEFYHVVGVMDVGSPNTLSGLYVNGVLIGSTGSTDNVNDWAGGDGGGVGQKVGSTAGGNPTYAAFTGDIATLRLYGDHAFDQAAVNAAYSLVPEPTTFCLLWLGVSSLLMVRRRKR
jgi:hypothetical protein